MKVVKLAFGQILVKTALVFPKYLRLEDIASHTSVAWFIWLGRKAWRPPFVIFENFESIEPFPLQELW